MTSTSSASSSGASTSSASAAGANNDVSSDSGSSNSGSGGSQSHEGQQFSDAVDRAKDDAKSESTAEPTRTASPHVSDNESDNAVGDQDNAKTETTTDTAPTASPHVSDNENSPTAADNGFGSDSDKDKSRESGASTAETSSTTSTKSPEPQAEEPSFFESVWDGVEDIVEEVYDSAQDIDEQYDVLQRGLGVVQTIAGAAETIAGGAIVLGGAAATTTGAGAFVGVPTIVGGGALATKGVDDVLAGIKTIWTGDPQDTHLDDAVETLGTIMGATPNQVTAAQIAIGSIGSPTKAATKSVQMLPEAVPINPAKITMVPNTNGGTNRMIQTFDNQGRPISTTLETTGPAASKLKERPRDVKEVQKNTAKAGDFETGQKVHSGGHQANYSSTGTEGATYNNMTAEYADLPGYVGKLDDVTADQSKSGNLSISITKNSWDDHKVAAPDEIVREIIVHNKKGDVTINRFTTIDNTTGQANLTKQDVAKTPPVVVPKFDATTMVTPKATREAIEQRANVIKQNAALQRAKE